MKSIYIYGASGHGLVVAEIAIACGYDNIIFIDDGENDYPKFEDVKINNHIPIAFGIGNNSVRKKLLKKLLEYNFKILTLVHPSAIISPSTTLGIGTVVMPNVIINAKTIVGKACILNTGCIIEHENLIEDFVHLSPSVSLAGNVTIGYLSHLGINSCIIQGLNVGYNCVIGAGSVVTKNINNLKKAYGNPCKEIEDIK